MYCSSFLFLSTCFSLTPLFFFHPTASLLSVTPSLRVKYIVLDSDHMFLFASLPYSSPTPIKTTDGLASALPCPREQPSRNHREVQTEKDEKQGEALWTGFLKDLCHKLLAMKRVVKMYCLNCGHNYKCVSGFHLFHS